MPIIKKNIAILDYGFGNIFKIKQAVEYNGFICTLITDLKDIDEYDALILPGVGSFPEGMKRLNKIKAKEKILEFVKKKKLLGICLGIRSHTRKSCTFSKKHQGSCWVEQSFY